MHGCIWAYAFTFLSLLITNCGSKKNKAPPSNNSYQLDLEQGLLSKQEWTEKAARFFLNGSSLSEDELALIKNLPEDQILQRLLGDIRFSATALNFALQYLGFRDEKYKHLPGETMASFENSALELPNAINAAIEMTKENGNFFKIFEEADTSLLLPIRPINIRRLMPEEKNLSHEELVDLAFVGMIEKIETFIGGSIKSEDDKKKLCGLDESFFTEFYRRSGISFDLLNRIITGPPGILPIFIYCNNGETTPSENLVADQKKNYDRLPEIILILKRMGPKDYFIKTVLDIRPLPEIFQRNPETPSTGHLPQEMWFKLPNSSTNLNRKRGAYALKRFFCDDLNPIGTLMPEHPDASNRHASDPSCQACHYKLDPMAGFFRYRGGFGDKINPEVEDTVRFSDGASADLSSYLSEWQTKDGSWNVAYVRSASDASKNSYSKNPDPGLADLFSLVRETPEGKQCFAKTAARFVLGSEVGIDPEYIDLLASNFSSNEAQSSAHALRQLFSSLVQSRSFKTRDLVPGECYDFASGEQEANRPPLPGGRPSRKKLR